MQVPDSLEEIARYALELEKDGIKFYTERATVAEDDYEQSLFQSLAKDEEKHIAALEAVLRSGGLQDAPDLLSKLKAEDPKEVIKTIFSEVGEEKGKRSAASSESLKPFDVALGMEKKGYAFYTEAAEKVQSDQMRSLLRALAKMESAHIDVVTQSRLYLEEPERWFFENEPWILD